MSDERALDRENLKIPQHLAIIMDGNGRWAKGKILPRLDGHKNGVRSVRMVCEESRRLGIRYLTLFAFSTENWNRPALEVTGLMSLFAQYLESELQLLKENGIRLRVIGDLTRLPSKVQKLMQQCQDATKNEVGMDLILAISYGGREEIVNAAKQIAIMIESGDLTSSQVNEQVFRKQLYLSDVPDPDLLIRTSDEFRISNFLLWQLAYSEIVVSPVLWPEFSESEFFRCLEEFSGRTRRFGLTDEQINIRSLSN